MAKTRKYNALLFTFCFQQSFVLDYNETFVAMGKFSIFYFSPVLLVAANLELRQINVKTDSLNAELVGYIAMERTERSLGRKGQISFVKY